MFCLRGLKAHFALVLQFLLENSERKNVISMREFWPPSWKTWRDFRRSSKQKRLRTLCSFEMFPISSNILNSLMESWCIVSMGNQFFSDKINLKTVS